MGWQDFAALGSVTFAVAFLVYKFVLEDRLRARKPHVPVSALVRRNKRPLPKPSHGCH